MVYIQAIKCAARHEYIFYLQEGKGGQDKKQENIWAICLQAVGYGRIRQPPKGCLLGGQENRRYNFSGCGKGVWGVQLFQLQKGNIRVKRETMRITVAICPVGQLIAQNCKFTNNLIKWKKLQKTMKLPNWV